MNRLGKAVALVMGFCLCFGLSACGNGVSPAEAPKEESTQAESIVIPTEEEEAPASGKESSDVREEIPDEPVSIPEAEVSEQEAEPAGADALVVYFSATGTTKGVAEKIAAIESADLYEIIPAEPYSSADLNWNDSESRSTREQNDSSVRPEIAGEPIGLDRYAKIYVGYPIWWGEEPRIMDTFVESYNFGNAAVIPFCTSSSSGIGRSGKNLAENAGSGNWLEGARFGGGVSEDELRAWVEGLQ